MVVDLFVVGVGLLLLGVQVATLVLLVQDSSKDAEFHCYRFYSPQAWFTLFFGLYFLLPAVVSLLPGHHIIGFEAESTRFRLQSAVTAQFYLLTFLIAVFGGSRLTAQMLPQRLDNRPLRFRRSAMKGLDQLLLLTFFICGLLATMYLAWKNIGSGSAMRSALVKSTSGKILTSISFFGNFAFAVFLARSLVRRRILMAVAVIAIFVPAVFLTGSRGRFMWPCVLALVYLFSYRNAFDVKKLAIAATLGLSVLIFSDTILLVLKNDRELSFAGIRNLFIKRNFDGFANFTLISTFDQIPHRPLVALIGARQEFMYHYFPSAYQKGVGFGATWPGMSWIAGGWIGLLIGGVVYGYILGAVNALFRKIEDERLFWAYLFAMTWLCAAAGNIHESLDKMAVAAAPGVVWFILNQRIGRPKTPAPTKTKRRRRFRTRQAIVGAPE